MDGTNHTMHQQHDSEYIQQPVDSDRPELVARIRAALAGLMNIERFAWDKQGLLLLEGQLTGPAETTYRTIRQHLEPLGYTPFLRRRSGRDELVAVPGVTVRNQPRIWLPLILFCTTLVTVLLTGAILEQPSGPPIDSLGALIQVVFGILSEPQRLLSGLPFAATLLGILFTHEMGHYIVGRLRGAPVSLPYFIPMPPGYTLGTLGAVIVQREPMEDRRTILEIGIAGPLAGLAVAIPLLLYGLSTSEVGPSPVGAGIVQEGNSLFYLAAKWLVFGRYLPSNGIDVHLNTVALASWFGLLVTMLNLMPIGQLDGGHVSYALLGERAHYLAYAMVGVAITLGTLQLLGWGESGIWFIWVLLAMILNPRHPPPLNNISGIGRGHTVLAIAGLIIFGLLFTPFPWTEIQASAALP